MQTPVVRSIRSSPFLFVLLLVLLALATNACAPAATPTPAAPSALFVPTAAPAATSLPPKSNVAPTGVPPTAAPRPTQIANSAASGSTLPNVPAIAAIPLDRKIIKNSQLVALVSDVDVAVARMTGIAIDVGGYLFSSRSFFEGNRKIAQVTISVPVDRFEDALNLVRKIATKIESDTSASSDVSDQYVDLESRLKNLQATADRIREFLSKAQSVEEALKINAQLAAVDAQIEEIKGKLNALNARSAFSTITADLREPIPTPTPTYTPTITPTPEPTMTPTPTLTPTPVAWQPDKTFNNAATVQGGLLRALGDLLIWVVVLLLPYVVLFSLLGYAFMWVARQVQRRPPTHTPNP